MHTYLHRTRESKLLEMGDELHKQTSDADPEDVVIVPEIHCPHQTRILFCSDTSPLNDWDLDLQTPDIMQIF